jgi:hypothetical protein
MHVQTPQLTIPHRNQVVAALAAVAAAGAAFGIISIANDDESTPSSQAPAVTNVDTSRVLDGSPILRGTANRVDTNRVLDGSPLVRGHAAAAIVTVPHPRLDGAPFGVKPPTALQPPNGRPEGFHGR